MFHYYIVILIFGRVAAVTGPVEDHASCKIQAESKYEQIVTTAKSKGVTSVVIEGKIATQKDLVVICKGGTNPPKITIDITNLSS